MTRLYRQIQKGDVVLVEGELRISQLIKYTTQSPWSHSALYVGDELLRRGGRLREQALASFGELADRLLIEALTEQGVVAVPLAKYQSHNVRICRPYGISPADLDKVIDSVLADLGKQYDSRNLFDLTLLLLSPIKVGPLRRRTVETCLGHCTDLEVICSGMIAKAFHRVGFQILPSLPLRHHSQIMPRDFDLSPNFEIVKFGVIQDDGSTPKATSESLSEEDGELSRPLAEVRQVGSSWLPAPARTEAPCQGGQPSCPSSVLAGDPAMTLSAMSRAAIPRRTGGA